MSQQRKGDKSPKHSPPVKPPVKEDKAGKWLGRVLGWKSFILLVAGFLLVYACVTQNSAYRWTWENLLKNNWEITRKYAKASLDERYQMKLNVNFTYLNYVKQNTPDDAVILFPLKDGNRGKIENYQLGSEINNKFWVTRFLYPRKVVYKEEKDINPWYKEVSHVAIIAGRGYEDLDYVVKERTSFTVLPKTVNETK